MSFIYQVRVHYCSQAFKKIYVLPRNIFWTLSNIYDGAFLWKQWITFSYAFATLIVQSFQNHVLDRKAKNADHLGCFEWQWLWKCSEKES